MTTTQPYLATQEPVDRVRTSREFETLTTAARLARRGGLVVRLHVVVVGEGRERLRAHGEGQARRGRDLLRHRLGRRRGATGQEDEQRQRQEQVLGHKTMCSFQKCAGAELPHGVISASSATALLSVSAPACPNTSTTRTPT